MSSRLIMSWDLSSLMEPSNDRWVSGSSGAEDCDTLPEPVQYVRFARSLALLGHRGFDHADDLRTAIAFGHVPPQLAAHRWTRAGRTGAAGHLAGGSPERRTQPGQGHHHGAPAWWTDPPGHLRPETGRPGRNPRRIPADRHERAGH